MNKFFITFLLTILSIVTGAQTIKVAILDFENTSGKPEFDALGKSMSSMLITDLKNNIHPRKVEFFERGQLNKLLDEQQLQKSKDFDAQTAVGFGKLSGVNYVFVGSLFVAEGVCNITSKLVNVETAEIEIAKDVNGAVETWLQLKTQLALVLATELNNPIVLTDEYSTQSTSLATINQYGKILSTMDSGDSQKAEEMRALFEETNPSFAYFKDIKEEIDKLKVQVQKNTEDIETLNKSGGRVINATSLPEIMMNITNPLTPYDERTGLFTSMLSYRIDEISALLGRFTSACGFPSSSELLTSYDKYGNPTDKTFELITKDVNYITTLLDNNTLNKETFSSYSFFYMRRLARFLTKYNTKEELRTSSHSLATKLKEYNALNGIPSYSASTFGGEAALSLEFDKDIDISIDHLINLLSPNVQLIGSSSRIETNGSECDVYLNKFDAWANEYVKKWQEFKDNQNNPTMLSEIWPKIQEMDAEMSKWETDSQEWFEECGENEAAVIRLSSIADKIRSAAN
jgi:TolB-like protein